MPVVRLKQRAKWNGLMLTSRASASIVRSSGKLLATCSVILESCFGESVAVRRAMPGMLAHRDAMREASARDKASAYELPVGHPESISARMRSISVATRASSKPMCMSNNASVRPKASIGFGSGPISVMSATNASQPALFHARRSNSYPRLTKQNEPNDKRHFASRASARYRTSQLPAAMRNTR